MSTTTRLVDGVYVIELRTVVLDPANHVRNPQDSRRLGELLDEIALTPNLWPIIADLSRLEDLTGWELSDLVSILSRVIVDWKFDRLVVITDRPLWRQKLQQQYRNSVVLFPQINGDAIAAAMTVFRDREAKQKQAV